MASSKRRRRRRFVRALSSGVASSTVGTTATCVDECGCALRSIRDQKSFCWDMVERCEQSKGDRRTIRVQEDGCQDILTACR